MTKPTLSQLRRFIGNPDAYAVQLDDGQWRPRRGERLSDAVLRKHLNEEVTVGTYLGFKVEETGRTGTNSLCLDVDTGFKEDAANLASVLVTQLRVPSPCVGIEFSGRKGYHVWVLFPYAVQNKDARRLGRAALALAKLDVEVYPKQDEVTDLGNLVKLPGGLHRVSGKRNDFIGEVPRQMTPSEWGVVFDNLPVEVTARSAYKGENRFPCLEAIQDEGAEEGSRNISLVHLGVMLRRAGVTDDFVDMVVRAVNERGDPLDEVELEQAIRQSAQTGPLCTQLPAERHCGDLCIQNRLRGLKDMPGQLRGAAVGEKVVVTVTERKGDELTLEHSDVSKLRGVLRER